MKKRLASLFLLLVLAGSTLAGVPLHFGESECGMSMMEMDCCKAAWLRLQTPEVAAARLCCALNCAQNNTTSPPDGVPLTAPAPVRTPFPAALAQALPLLSFRSHAIDRLHGPPVAAPPYLRNLALLI